MAGVQSLTCGSWDWGLSPIKRTLFRSPQTKNYSASGVYIGVPQLGNLPLTLKGTLMGITKQGTPMQFGIYLPGSLYSSHSCCILRVPCFGVPILLPCRALRWSFERIFDHLCMSRGHAHTLRIQIANLGNIYRYAWMPGDRLLQNIQTLRGDTHKSYVHYPRFTRGQEVLGVILKPLGFRV